MSEGRQNHIATLRPFHLTAGNRIWSYLVNDDYGFCLMQIRTTENVRMKFSWFYS